MAEFISRSAWGARAPRGRTGLSASAQRGAAIHWEGPRMGAFGHDQCDNKVRIIQTFHMDSRGWSDIAYNFLVCSHGCIFEGRGWGTRSAAQGTNTGNDSYHAICYLGGEGDPFTDEAKDAYNTVIDELRRRYAHATDVRPHSAFHATACPGNEIRNWITAGRPGGTPVPQPEPTPPTPVPDWDARLRAKVTLRQGHTGQEVRILQGALKAHADLRIVVDGDFGPATARTLRDWQGRTGVIAADGVCGPDSWAWLGGNAPTLARGSRDWHVFLLQGLMVAHSATPVTVDGAFGPQTETSLRNWQARTGILTADGICGPDTWGWLMNA